jgi:predicted RNA-binding Zn-ribbon protein involved in translation (DUF1610 family)
MYNDPGPAQSAKPLKRKPLGEKPKGENMSEKMDWYCRNCYGEGEIEYPFRGEESALVICQHCQHLSAYYWCAKCGMGGQISREDPTNLSTGWTCISCNSEYPFSMGFHNRIITFTPIAFGSEKPIYYEDSTVRRWEKIRYLFIGGTFLFFVLFIIDM